MEEEMNICFLLGGFTKVGGIGRVTSIISNELAKDKVMEIHVISFSKNDHPILYQLDSSIRHSYLFDYELNVTKAMLRHGSNKLRNYIKKNGIDVLIAAGAMFYPIGVMATVGSKTKVIAWEHANVQNKNGFKFQKFARRIGAKYSDHVVTLTEHDKEGYRSKYHIDNVRHIYNPIDDELINHVRDYNIHSKRIISVGRLSYQKNFASLINIARTVLPKFEEWSWDIYGEGEEKSALQEMIVEYGLTDQIVLKGRVDNLYELYNQYSFLVMTSRYEGFPMTLLEGMSQGLPLISYDIVTGPNEIIVQSQNGFLAEANNENEMIRYIENLILDKAKRLEMSNANLALSGRYLLTNIISEWRGLFESLIER